MRILIRFVNPSEILPSSARQPASLVVQIVKTTPKTTPKTKPKSKPKSKPASTTTPSSGNTKYLVTSLITSGLLAISESLPFLPNETNGILDIFIHLVAQRVNSDK